MPDVVTVDLTTAGKRNTAAAAAPRATSRDRATAAKRRGRSADGNGRATIKRGQLRAQVRTPVVALRSQAASRPRARDVPAARLVASKSKTTRARSKDSKRSVGARAIRPKTAPAKRETAGRKAAAATRKTSRTRRASRGDDDVMTPVAAGYGTDLLSRLLAQQSGSTFSPHGYYDDSRASPTLDEKLEMLVAQPRAMRADEYAPPDDDSVTESLADESSEDEEDDDDGEDNAEEDDNDDGDEEDEEDEDVVVLPAPVRRKPRTVAKRRGAPAPRRGRDSEPQPRSPIKRKPVERPLAASHKDWERSLRLPDKTAKPRRRSQSAKRKPVVDVSTRRYATKQTRASAGRTEKARPEPDERAAGSSADKARPEAGELAAAAANVHDSLLDSGLSADEIAHVLELRRQKKAAAARADEAPGADQAAAEAQARAQAAAAAARAAAEAQALALAKAQAAAAAAAQSKPRGGGLADTLVLDEDARVYAASSAPAVPTMMMLADEAEEDPGEEWSLAKATIGPRTPLRRPARAHSPPRVFTPPRFVSELAREPTPSPPPDGHALVHALHASVHRDPVPAPRFEYHSPPRSPVRTGVTSPQPSPIHEQLPTTFHTASPVYRTVSPPPTYGPPAELPNESPAYRTASVVRFVSPVRELERSYSLGSPGSSPGSRVVSSRVITTQEHLGTPNMRAASPVRRAPPPHMGGVHYASPPAMHAVASRPQPTPGPAAPGAHTTYSLGSRTPLAGERPSSGGRRRRRRAPSSDDDDARSSDDAGPIDGDIVYVGPGATGRRRRHSRPSSPRYEPSAADARPLADPRVAEPVPDHESARRQHAFVLGSGAMLWKYARRSIKKVHRRFVTIDVQTGVMTWGETRHAKKQKTARVVGVTPGLSRSPNAPLDVARRSFSIFAYGSRPIELVADDERTAASWLAAVHVMLEGLHLPF